MLVGIFRWIHLASGHVLGLVIPSYILYVLNKTTPTDVPVLLQLFTSKMASKMPMLDWKHEPLSESFKALKARLNKYYTDQEITNDAKHTTKFQIAVGDEGMRRMPFQLPVVI